jgi:N-methylhydantoinase A
MGCVIADMRQDFVQTINSVTKTLDTGALRQVMQQHIDDGMGHLDAAQSQFEGRDIIVELDMAYVGQTHTVAVPLAITVDDMIVTAPTIEEIEAAFDVAYQATYGRLLENGTQRVMNLRTAVIGRRPKFDLTTLAPKGGTIEAAYTGTRKVHFGHAWFDTAIYNRLALPVGATIAGPAILVQPDTTVLVDPGLTARMDSCGNTIITRDKD